jgi:hypothetical protein
MYGGYSWVENQRLLGDDLSGTMAPNFGVTTTMYGNLIGVGAPNGDLG